MDLSKLSPAPLVAWIRESRGASDFPSSGHIVGLRTVQIDREWAMTPDDAEFFALARNAFDVMTRRGWGLKADARNISGPNGESFTWFIVDSSGNEVATLHLRGLGVADPFTALVEADAWLTSIEAPRGDQAWT